MESTRPQSEHSHDQDEWEYEYDEDDFEEHLIKLDLTSFRRSSHEVAPPDGRDAVQIRGLHQSHPLIMYRGTLYKCEWGSTLGTDLFIGKTDALKRRHLLSSQPERSSGLGMGCCTLTGRPAQIEPQQDVETGFTGERAGLDVTTTLVQQSRNSHKGQTAFLSQLATVKGSRENTRAVP
ncbi:MAG: hypothetical protein M1828_003450 [Chrysothrix sp. TS-e1954]|nr:MAG: hypothetical protein M1828_003450 [Chrysothrix sp. TS-e1954]